MSEVIQAETKCIVAGMGSIVGGGADEAQIHRSLLVSATVSAARESLEAIERGAG